MSCAHACDVDTSARQSDIRVCVHEELHMKHVAHFLVVEDEDPLKQDHVCRVDCDLVIQSANTHAIFLHIKMPRLAVTIKTWVKY